MIEHYDLVWSAPLCGIRFWCCCCSNCHWFSLVTNFGICPLHCRVIFLPFFGQKFLFLLCPYFCNLLYYRLGLLKCTPNYAVEFKSSTSCFVIVHFFYFNFSSFVFVLFDSITSWRGSRLLLKAKIALFISVIKDRWLLTKKICHICLPLRPMPQIWWI